ncbi:MAG: type I secretion system permease/ATPase [Tateyamaria sp.]|jgi:PrtD family type I secretion system ABC transporter|nr:type I secretion system permease/ATPase [Tateyamaria sp.]MBT6267372.1 type I secretion system permease/ATPase [Tateyamaria sp.]MBT6343901.1 type I secretion system permease/ATPase [Tateyamaria sp.]MBT7447381.1 type I secretion system permease/ATPase [Tateyamaria sp.]MBT7801609.1 type I secretion system permease/ATPase [Tateyamaria sp.]
MAQNQTFGKEELREARAAGKWLLRAVFVFSIFVNILMLTGPLFMLQVYDRVLGSRSEETLVALFILVAALFGLMGVLDYARGRVLARFGARFQSKLDDRIFEAVLARALLPKERGAPANGLRDLESVQALFTSPLMVSLFDVPWTPLFIAAIFIFHPWLGWMAVFGGVTLIIITLLNNLLTRRKTLAAQEAAGQASNFAEQVRRSAEVVQSQGMGTAVSERWHSVRDQALVQTVRSSDLTGLFSSTTKAFRSFLQSAMLAVGAYLVLQGEMTAGAMIAGSILLGRALAPIEQSIGQWPMVQRARGAWISLIQLLETTPPPSKKLALSKPTATIAFKSVTVMAQGSKTPTLSSVTFKLSPGEVMGVIGKSGSGKSTLAKSMLGLTQIVAGEVRFGGATLDQYDSQGLGLNIGYLPQNVVLFSGTIAENIARMSTKSNDQEIIKAAKRANAHEMILSLPNGYETVMQSDDGQLSGGQKQRIGLARALYSNPVLLILDEPNSALDHDGSIALNLAVREFKESDRSVVILTHRPTAISECDRLLIIDEGRIKADGPRDEVLNSMVSNVREIHQTISKASPP